MSDSLALFFLALILMAGCFALVRNQAVYAVRIAFIRDDDLYPDAYLALPSYGSMAYKPRHWLRFTKSQWVEWLKAQGAAA